jgi:hypothetical protein
MNRTKKIIAEVVQFVPIITLASTFIVKGGVDVNQAGTLFVISGFCALVITGILVFSKVMLNPILLGTNLWLLAGAAAFGIPLPALADLLSQTNGVLLFAAVMAVGIILTLFSPTGYIGMTGVDKATVRRLSLLLIGLTAGALLWSIIFKNNIRLGGGVPFIIVNITRRMLIRRAVKKMEKLSEKTTGNASTPR